MARPRREEDKPLTDTEIQIMNVLWDLGAVTVHDVQEALNQQQGKEYAYTTVSTMLRVLEKKSVVRSEKQGRGHIYSAGIAQKDYQKKATDHLVEQVFSGSRSDLLKNLLGAGALSAKDLNEVRELLDSKRKK
ncbi:MAG: transcriptional regulator [Bdellovibrionaceae bacterium]|nr:transcriptional regulator [Pseudobdellovibrionaceae bacterium]|tara:strand:+ start:500 stop:898 length:399 start_codon:yes stop_codon:yes gene_type:complete